MVSELWVHYREGRRFLGMPIVMLHPTPECSLAIAPLAEILSSEFRIVAPDIPGYGLSEPLPVVPPAMMDYVRFLKCFLDKIVGSRYILYGRGSGAQFAIAFANCCPSRVIHLFLDEAYFFSDDERDQIRNQYFIDLTPRSDGGHLVEAWRMSALSLQFFPWFENDNQHRIRSSEPTPEEVATRVRPLLNSGVRYADGCRVAFDHARIGNLYAVTVPTTLFRRKQSYGLKYAISAAPDALPSNISIVDLPNDAEECHKQTLLAMRIVHQSLLLDCFPAPT